MDLQKLTEVFEWGQFAQLLGEFEDLSAEPFAVAYQLVEKFSARFDLPAPFLPFVADTGGARRVDVSALPR